jgi:DNA polymerase-3 subunit alpha
MATIEEAVKRAGQNARNQNAGMVDLFGEVVPDDSDDVYLGTENIRQWSEKERLNLEKDTLGLYLTGHPFDQYEKEVRQFAPNAIVNLKSSRSKTTIVGLIVDIRVMKNKRGQTMCFVTLDDRSGRIEGMLFADTYDECREAIVKDTIVVIEGVAKIDEYSGSMKLRVSKVRSLLEARAGFAERLEISLDQHQFENGFISSLKDVIEPYKRGTCKMAMRYRRPEAETLIELGADWGVKPTDELMDDLRYLLGNEKVRLVY